MARSIPILFPELAGKCQLRLSRHGRGMFGWEAAYRQSMGTLAIDTCLYYPRLLSRYCKVSMCYRAEGCAPHHSYPQPAWAVRRPSAAYSATQQQQQHNSTTATAMCLPVDGHMKERTRVTVSQHNQTHDAKLHAMTDRDLGCGEALASPAALR